MTEPLPDFRTFTRQVRLRGTLETTTALRVGAGRTYDLLGDDLPVVKDVLGRPVIPGSSLKGALRAYAERILRTLEPLVQPGMVRLSCDPLIEPCLTNDEVAAIKTEGNADERLRERSCWACRVFGAPWMASRVLVKDLLVREEEWLGLFGHRDGVSIDRDKGTAQEKRRYTFEVVPKGTPFDLEIVVDGATDAELGLLLLALEAFDTGAILLGGARSRGLGNVSLKIGWDHVEVVTSEIALEWFGDRALGHPPPTTAWSPSQREAWIETFFQVIALPEEQIRRWREARSEREVQNER